MERRRIRRTKAGQSGQVNQIPTYLMCFVRQTPRSRLALLSQHLSNLGLEDGGQHSRDADIEVEIALGISRHTTALKGRWDIAIRHIAGSRAGTRHGGLW